MAAAQSRLAAAGTDSEAMKRAQEKLMNAQQQLTKAEARMNQAQQVELQRQLQILQKIGAAQATAEMKKQAEMLEPELQATKRRQEELQRGVGGGVPGGVPGGVEGGVPGGVRTNNEQERERRIRYADERFERNGVRGSETDRGRIYIVHGPPDEIESHPSEQREEWLWRGGLLLRFEGPDYKLVGAWPQKDSPAANSSNPPPRQQ